MGLRLLIIIYLSVVIGGVVIAHGESDWIRKGGYQNKKGESCCGHNDCFRVDPNQVDVMRDGYLLWSVEFVPYGEVMASRDGSYWRCRKPDGSRRCFFAPPPSI